MNLNQTRTDKIKLLNEVSQGKRSIKKKGTDFIYIHDDMVKVNGGEYIPISECKHPYFKHGYTPPNMKEQGENKQSRKPHNLEDIDLFIIHIVTNENKHKYGY